MQWSKVNLNNLIRFRLTPTGRDLVEKLNRVDMVFRRAPLRYVPDEEGWCQDDLWRVMQVFGPHMVGSTPPIELNCLIQCIPLHEHQPSQDGPRNTRRPKRGANGAAGSSQGAAQC